MTACRRPSARISTGAASTSPCSREHATAVDLCLFDPGERHETRTIRLPCRTDDVWHGYLRGVLPGQLYGYRVHGPWDPAHGHRFNPAKLLLDPYAREIRGRIRWHDALYGHRRGLQREDQIDRRDSAVYMPHGVVTAARGARPRAQPGAPAARRDGDLRGARQGADPARIPDVPEAERGTYAALAHPAIIEHLRQARRHRPGAPADPGLRGRPLPGREGARQFLGLLARSTTSRRIRATSGPAGIGGLKAAIRELHAAGIET